MYLTTLETCLTPYELDPARFHSGLELSWKVPLNKTKLKLDLYLILTCYEWKRKVSAEEYNTLFIYMPKLITNT